MKTEITSLINGNTLGPIEGTTPNMVIEIVGTAGTITGSISVNGETWTDVDTYDMTGTDETFNIYVAAAGVLVKLTTTGSFTEAYLIKEG